MTHHRPQHETPHQQHRVHDTTRGATTAHSFDADRGYWQERYTREPYYEAGHAFGDYEPGYRAGYDGHQRYSGQTFDAAESQMRADYERVKGEAKPGWNKVKKAARAAWQRLEEMMPGDADRGRH